MADPVTQILNEASGLVRTGKLACQTLANEHGLADLNAVVTVLRRAADLIDALSSAVDSTEPEGELDE